LSEINCYIANYEYTVDEDRPAVRQDPRACRQKFRQNQQGREKRENCASVQKDAEVGAPRRWQERASGTIDRTDCGESGVKTGWKADRKAGSEAGERRGRKSGIFKNGNEDRR
jgi:hypothetical protein